MLRRQKRDAQNESNDEQQSSDEDVQRPEISKSSRKRPLTIVSSPGPEDAPMLDDEELAMAEDLGGDEAEEEIQYNHAHNDTAFDGDYNEEDQNGKF
jgi:hypothetical protein